MNKDHYVVIMAGGIGSRFWPFSRANNPKQFHDVLGVGESMLQQTARRFQDICPVENIYVVTNRDYKHLVEEQLPFVQQGQVLCEPVGRNTAPAIAYACYKIAAINSEARIIVTPSDHVIRNEQVFEEIALQALEAAEKDILITLGIKPSRPDTGYGYIQFLEEPGKALKKVKTFTEKPSLDLARMFLQSGDFVWNAGIFIWNAQAILKAFRELLPEVAEIFEEGAGLLGTRHEEEFIEKAYTQCRNISIDYGIMEKASNVYVLLADFGWSDLGTWNSLHAVGHKDDNGNMVDGDVMLYDVHDCIIKTPKERLVVLQGLDGYIIAEYDNVLMICRKDEEQRVKEFVADVKARRGSSHI